ncbi:Cysteine-rich receptor-like protein kinase 3 [Glycine soja]|uniref:Cysteine-rich receptor-like protein kinase 3 n=1 Tax=Glycine soja TaxID=3848 RepID=A0A0B2Q3J5_GLYSO|nr:Cysteine-rich receptor-like protein kinase 3 [Glycine soja]
MSLASFFLIFLCYHALPALADPSATEVAVLSTNTTAPIPQRQAFLTNFYDALEALTALVTRQKYALIVKGTTQNNATVYAFGECAKDLTKPDCDVCFAQYKTRVLRTHKSCYNCGRLQHLLPWLLLIVATMIFFVRTKLLKRRRERRQFGALFDTVNKSKLNVPYEIL